MKKLFVILAITGILTACNDSAKSDSSTTGDTSATTTPTTTTPDTAAVTATAPAVKDSMMQFKDGKVQVSIGGTWSDLSAAITTSNGRKVSPNGEVSKNGKTRKLEEGMMIDKDGQLMDKEGKLVDNTGWE